jgi:hypothetical protein
VLLLYYYSRGKSPLLFTSYYPDYPAIRFYPGCRVGFVTIPGLVDYKFSVPVEMPLIDAYHIPTGHFGCEIGDRQPGVRILYR